VLEFYGSIDKFEMLRSSSSRGAILVMLITSGVAHLPPMKVVTILSGAAAVDIWLFIGSAIVARGAKFFVIAWLLRRYGEPIREFIEKRLGLIALAAAVALILIYFAVKFLFKFGA
jgi:membrane protein YqaA with SNARE-associated domain